MGPGLRVHISDQLLGDAATMGTRTSKVPGDPSESEVLGDFSGSFQDWEGGVQEQGQSGCATWDSGVPALGGRPGVGLRAGGW